MHVYISIDMEGVAGVASVDQVARGGYGYPRAQALMTAEANAAIAGAFEGGATKVTVNDSHGTMDNLLHEQLDERADLIFGSPKAQCMAHGMSAEHDLALFVGYHAAAGEAGVLSHTFSSFFSSFRLNGETVSEAEVNALYAATHGVPVGLVSGDDVICSVVGQRLSGVVTVPVKRAEGWTAATSMHPARAREAIKVGARDAVRATTRLAPVRVPDRLVLDVGMHVPTAVEVAALVPGAEQTSAYGVRIEVATPAELLGVIAVWYDLATSHMRGHMALRM